MALLHGSADQPQLQRGDTAKGGIAANHDSLRTKLKATGCLQGIGCAQAMLSSQASGLLNHIGGQLNPQEIRLSKQGIKTIQADLISSPQGANPAFQKTEPAGSDAQG